MSTQSRAKSVLENPQSSIGAQDLLKVGSPSKWGFIRKQGTLERIFKFLTWRQRFVVLSRGCIYIFKNEFSGYPIKAVSMRVFLKCQRLRDSSIRWAFQLHPERSSADKIISFACSDDNIRKEWMKACKDEMMKAKKISDTEDNSNRDEYVYLEREVRSASPPVPTQAETGNDREEDYQTIDESRLPDLAYKSDKKPSPPAVSTIGSKPVVATKKTKPKPKIPTPPESPRATDITHDHGDVARQTFQFEGSNREEIKNLLTDRPEGTYLVRKSRMDQREVLSVNIEGTLKEYKIFEKDSQYSINNKDYFSSLERLLKHYMKNPLPNRTALLKSAYSETDSGTIDKSRGFCGRHRSRSDCTERAV